MKNLIKSTKLHSYFIFLILITIAIITTLFAYPVAATNVSEDLAYYEIKLSATPLDGGVLSGDGIYEEGTEINIVAEASDGYYFTGWVENGEIISTDSNLSLTVTENRDLIAVFEISITVYDNNDSDITLNYVSGEHSYTTLGPITSYTQYLERLYGHGKGRITQYPSTGHMAIDSVNDGPTPHKVYALSGGVIQSMGTDSHGGLYIYVRVPELNNNRFLYLHFASRNPSLYVGQTIKTGHYLGIEGSTGFATGRHTHFAVIDRDNVWKELEPWYWLNRIPNDGGYPPPTGALRVTIEPSDARSAGAQWRLTSGPDTGWKNSGSTISNLPVGSYTITYKDINGWNKPANASVSVSSNQTTSRTGTYNIKNYTLYVRSTNPTSGVTITSSTGHGGITGDNEYQISVAHGTSYNLTAPQYVGSGNSRKSFQKWDGTHPSSNRTVSGIMDGGRLFKAIYVDDPEPPGSVKVTIEPSEARSAGAQWRLTSGPDTGWKSSGTTISNLPTGSYTITFRDISGWDKPPNISVNVTADSTMQRTGTYTEIITLTAPTLIFPANGSVVSGTGDDNRITFQWSSSAGADHYKMALRRIGDTSWTETSVITTTSFSFINFPNNGTQYEWLVIAGNNKGQWSNWSPSWTFTNSAASQPPPSAWHNITETKAQTLAVDNGVVVGSFTGHGVYRYVDGSWQRLTGSVASELAIDGEVIVGSFTGHGVYRYVDGSWQQLTGSVASKLVFDSGVLVGSFPDHGVFHYTGTGWQRLTGSVASELAIDGEVIVGSFTGHGVYRYVDGSWQQLSTAKNIELLDYKDGLLVVSNSDGVWVYATDWGDLF